MDNRPDFNNLLKVLQRKKPDRYTLFEYYMNDRIYSCLTRDKTYDPQDELAPYRKLTDAFAAAGYDYVTITLPGFSFPLGSRGHGKSVSLNEGYVITGRESLSRYPWPDPAAARFDILDGIAPCLPQGMKIVAPQPVSIFGGAVNLLGYDNLCILLYEDEKLVADVFRHVGERILEFHRHTMVHPAVGACLLNDDWGFNQQTRISPAHLRKYVFPWYRQIVREVHAAGKPAILHSCGNPREIMEDIIGDMGFDARHSYEDAIIPVEDFYDRYGDRIAVLGGIDVDFMCRKTPEEIYERSLAMLRRGERGGYALGTGNSVPEYVPDENYFAMIRAALDNR